MRKRFLTAPNMTAIYGPVTGLVVSMLGVWISVMCLLIGQFVNLQFRRRADDVNQTLGR